MLLDVGGVGGGGAVRTVAFCSIGFVARLLVDDSSRVSGCFSTERKQEPYCPDDSGGHWGYRCMIEGGCFCDVFSLCSSPVHNSSCNLVNIGSHSSDVILSLECPVTLFWFSVLVTVGCEDILHMVGTSPLLGSDMWHFADFMLHAT